MILIACEYTGLVRDAFISAGQDAISCDLLPTERPGPHIQGDVLEVLGWGWNMMIGHPPCNRLAVSGARWFNSEERNKALQFAISLWRAPIPYICLENPISILSTFIGKPTQRIQPYHFGHTETKTTCLWLKNLPPLKATQVVPYRNTNLTPSGQTKKSKRDRARTYPGIAAAMADQWSAISK